MEQKSQEILLELVGQQKEMIALLEEQIHLLKESMARANEHAAALQQEIVSLHKQLEEKAIINGYLKEGWSIASGYIQPNMTIQLLLTR